MNGYEFTELLIIAMIAMVLIGGKKIPEAQERVVKGMGNPRKRVYEAEKPEENTEK